MKTTLTILLSCLCLFVFAHKNTTALNDSTLLNQIKSVTKKLDSLNSLYQSEIELNLKYLQIVDRTNESLNLTWTPLNTVIAIMTIILTIISVATILLAFGNHSQVNELLKNKSKDFDDRIDEKVRNAHLSIQDKFDRVEATIKGFFKENTPDTQEAKNFMFDMMGALEEMKKVVNRELMDNK